MSAIEILWVSVAVLTLCVARVTTKTLEVIIQRNLRNITSELRGIKSELKRRK